jgi:hypothetical protein
MASKAMDLFDAYDQNKLPKDEGFIISSFFNAHIAYSIYEVVSYSGVKEIYQSSEGLTFQTTGKKLYILAEPANYPNKAIEPYCRTTLEQIPQRFNDLEIMTAKNQTKIMFSKEPVFSYSAFTVLKPSGINFSLLFYKLPDIYDTMKVFFSKTLNKEAVVPMHDAEKVAEKVVELVEAKMSWPKEE